MPQPNEDHCAFLAKDIYVRTVFAVDGNRCLMGHVHNGPVANPSNINVSLANTAWNVYLWKRKF